MRILSVVGARPQFMKVAPIARACGHDHAHRIVHTGQHYDANMSAVFFDELDLPRADRELAIGSGSQGAQTGAMLAALEPVMLAERPDFVIVYGDTNSTLAGALVASKLHLPLAHVEAGLRSFNRAMPEEINRVVTDHLSDRLFCPSEVAVGHLRAEGIVRGVANVGDVMADALTPLAKRASERSAALRTLGLTRQRYVLATVHRAENTDDPGRLRAIIAALGAVDEAVVLPIHPRTRRTLERLGDTFTANVQVIDPVGYLDMLQLTQNARLVLTDSGGLQKEAYWLGVPCVTMRDQTEWVETVAAGWNVLAGTNVERIVAAVRTLHPPTARPVLYGDGHAAGRIVASLSSMN